MGYTSTLWFHILAFYLLGCPISGEVTFTIASITEPRLGQDPQTYTPPVADDYRYDIPAGSTVKLRCQVSVGEATVRFSTNDIALYQRFNGSRFGLQADGLWVLDDVRSYDTGSLLCYDPQGSGGSQSIYLFINDLNATLYVPWNSATVSLQVKYDYIPCLATYSTASLSIRSFIQPTPLSATIDLTKGVLLRNRPQPVPHTCTYELDSRSDSQKFTINDTGNSPVYPSPTVLPFESKYHYLAGQRLQLDCSVTYLTVQGMLWEYPAQACDAQPADDCQGSASRVTASEPAVQGDLVVSVLTVENLSPSDSGVYTCSYRPIGETDYKFPMSPDDIYVYPEPFVMGTPDITELSQAAGEDALLYVKLTALPSPKIVWKFNSSVLSDSSKYTLTVSSTYEHSVEYDVSLRINAVEAGRDGGTYKLEAIVDGDSVTIDFKLQVHEPPVVRLTHIYNGTKDVSSEATVELYVQPDKDVKLECLKIKGVPQPSISWFWQACDYLNSCIAQELISSWTPIPTEYTTPRQSSDAMFPNAAYYTMISPSQVNISLRADMSGWLRCTASNTVGTTDVRLQLVTSVLPETANGVGFTEQTLRQAKDLIEDDTFLLECRVVRFKCADTEVQIVETVSGKSNIYDKRTPESNFIRDPNDYGLSLEINVTEAMSGYAYLCRCASGQAGSKTLQLTVKKYVKASWLETPGADTNLTLGETRSFRCAVTGQPLPEVSWFKDNNPLEFSDMDTNRISPDGYNLTIVKAEMEDAGEYKCLANSRRDSLEFTFKLTVKEKPGITQGQIALIVLIVIGGIALAVVVTVYIVRKYCRKKYTPHTWLLPNKQTINPDIPLDEQTDALPYDIGWEFPYNRLKTGMLLGQGAFGRVLMAEAMGIEEGVASTTVAVKAVRDHSDIEQVKSLISELKILIHIGQHLNIVNLLGACTKDISEGHILVIVEYCRYGNLRSYLLKHKATFNPSMEIKSTDKGGSGVKLGHVSVNLDDDYLNETPTTLHSEENPVSMRDLISWSYQIARGMEYLASIDYIHRDLAARNVLLSDDNIVKICDFGLAKDIYKYQEYQKQTDGPLPIKWMALESLTHKVFNVRTDVWAYGVTVWELFSLAATPYPGWDIDDTFIDKLKDGFRMEIPKHCTQQIYEEVMLSCWHPDPEKRPNFAELAEMMGESVDSTLKEKLSTLEDPYLRSRDSRTDIKIRPSSVRKRPPEDLDSAYLTTKAVQKSNGSRPGEQCSNYYNTTPSGSQPSNKSLHGSWENLPDVTDKLLPPNESSCCEHTECVEAGKGNV
ncbi:vascular endothelial growth factor receptor 1-like isoform X2 [Watersipora subatra]|uniref:vascular endothelial growth factor receptor 1-like isoform X2 n=1 Tax=Watersipora subatra TaxID=2589382 RepID=UPI00355BA39A